jgi:hypothetical protein
MDNNLLDYYYDKIFNKESINEANSIEPDVEEFIRDHLKDCIKLKVDSLFSDAYLNYLSYSTPDSICFYLNGLVKNEISRIKVFKYFFTWMLRISLIDQDEEIKRREYPFFYKLDDTSFNTVDGVKKLMMPQYYIHSGKKEINNDLMAFTLGYCYVTNNMDKAYQICLKLSKEIDMIIDDKINNDLIYSTDEWYQRMITFINDRMDNNKRVIG